MNFIIRITGAFLFLILFCRPFISTAQTKDTLDKSGIDSNYVQDYTGWLTTRLYVLYQDASFIVGTNEVENIVFKPNTNIKIGIAGFYKWFGIGLSINNPFFQFNEASYGKTSSIDLRINGFGRSVAAEVFVQNFRGFYIRNIRPPTGHYTMPGMNLFSIGGYGYWIYNSKKFSFRAAFIQNERQVRSAGSFMIRPGFSYYRVSSDTGIVPGQIVNKYKLTKDEVVTGGQFYSVSLAPGYTYTFVFLKNVYINAAVFPGVSWVTYSYVARGSSYVREDFVFQLGIRLAAGFNTRKWYVGGALITGFNDLNAAWSNSSFYYDVSQFRFWGGVRFDVFRKHKKNIL